MRLLREPAKYKSTIGFTDLLFNLLVGFVFLFIIAFILINPITKKKDVPKKAEYMIIIEWPSMLVDDNCVQLEAFDPDVLITLERSMILFLAMLPL